MTGIQDRRLAVIQRVSREWDLELAGKVKPDPKYSHDGPSQYAEGINFLSAGPEADTELHRRVNEALAAEGLPTITVS